MAHTVEDSELPLAATRIVMLCRTPTTLVLGFFFKNKLLEGRLSRRMSQLPAPTTGRLELLVRAVHCCESLAAQLKEARTQTQTAGPSALYRDASNHRRVAHCFPCNQASDG